MLHIIPMKIDVTRHSTRHRDGSPKRSFVCSHIRLHATDHPPVVPSEPRLREMRLFACRMLETFILMYVYKFICVWINIEWEYAHVCRTQLSGPRNCGMAIDRYLCTIGQQWWILHRNCKCIMRWCACFSLTMVRLVRQFAMYRTQTHAHTLLLSCSLVEIELLCSNRRRSDGNVMRL